MRNVLKTQSKRVLNNDILSAIHYITISVIIIWSLKQHKHITTE